MYGRIVKFRRDLGIGVIRTECGNAFRFANTEIVNANGKLIGVDVDFLVAERRPREIFLMSGSPWTAFDRPDARQDTPHGIAHGE